MSSEELLAKFIHARRKMNSAISQTESSQFLILREISDGARKATQVADIIDYDRATVFAIVRGLCMMGCLQKDKQGMYSEYVLTEEGRIYLDQLTKKLWGEIESRLKNRGIQPRILNAALTVLSEFAVTDER